MQGEQKIVLVTGGAGFFGSQLCEFLLEKGKRVFCIDDYSSGREQNIDHLLTNPNFEFIRQNICEPFDLKKLPGAKRTKAAFIGIDEIYHLPVSGSPRYYLENPVEMMQACSVGTKNILDLASQFRSKFLYVSDSVVYGELSEPGFTPSEDYHGMLDYLNPLHAYAVAKRFGESLVQQYHRLNSLETYIVRLSNVYGPNMHLDDGRMVPELVASALEGKPLVLPSTFTSDSFCYIDDAVNALEKIMVSEEAKPGVYNVGNTTSYTLNEVAEKIIALTSAKSKIEIQSEPSSEIKELFSAWELHSVILNTNKIRDEIGWFPVVLLDEGLEKTVHYMKSLRGVKRLS